MDDIKQFAKMKKELETLIHSVRIYRQVRGMNLVIVKCAMIVMKSGKGHLTDGKELQSQDKIRTLGERKPTNTWTSWRLTPSNIVEIKEKSKKEYLRRTRKLLETKPSSRNLIKGKDTWAVTLVRCSGPLVKWTGEELKQMGQRTRKLMTKH